MYLHIYIDETIIILAKLHLHLDKDIYKFNSQNGFLGFIRNSKTRFQYISSELCESINLNWLLKPRLEQEIV